MPIVTVQMYDGRTLDQKRELVKGITEVVARVTGNDPQAVHVIIDDQLLNKQQSMSYEVRANADQMAWQILLETGALGLGLGSHRASSGLLSLLIGPGIIGATAFLLFIGSALRRPACPAAAQASMSSASNSLGSGRLR